MTKHGIPALLSFLFPGLGQIVKGHIFKGLGIWLALIISSVLVFTGLGLILVPVIWFWQIYDAYNA